MSIVVKGNVTLDYSRCNLCKLCLNLCPTNVFKVDENINRIVVNDDSCISCYGCTILCPVDAISVEVSSHTVIDITKHTEE
ncbi:MAG: 4Fe-4S binding protein [Ignisphaera sp.]